MDKLIEINTDQMETPKAADSLFVNRASFAQMQQQTALAEVTVILTAYNRLEKTKRCVESVLKYTQNVDYEFILIDNGSSDGTLEYFKTIPYSKKKMIHISKNLGGAYANLMLDLTTLGRFICMIPNDLIVTEHWLENLLCCMKSDPKIGMVNPVSSNTSNLQCVEFPFASYEEMQEKARQLNQSDPRKWEDRLRLITLGPLYRKEVLLGAGWPVTDVGFFHDFSDDDATFQVRRLGYRTVLAGDTWVCHDHDLQHGEGKNPVEFQRSLEIGRANFQEKHFGVDAWEDVNNYYIPYMNQFPTPNVKGTPRILGVDIKCGTPILDVKNWLRRSGYFQAELSAFTQDPKYWLDLKTICQGQVICDREEFLTDSFHSEYFDYVIADRPINRYHEPQKLLNDLFSLCKRGGVIACKLKNTFSFQDYVHLLGQWGVYDREFSYHIPLEVAIAALQKMGTVQIIAIPFPFSDEQRTALEDLLPTELPQDQRSDLFNRMLCREYLFVVKRK